MEAYQERVVAEKRELDAKLQKLEQFIDRPGFPAEVPAADGELLIRQRNIMREYSAILRKRIGRFPEA